MPVEDGFFECLLKGQGDAFQRPPVGMQSTSAIKLISYKVAPQKCVWVCEKNSIEKKVWEEMSVVRWAGELLPPVQVGKAGVCLSPCKVLPEWCPGSAVLASLSLSPVCLHSQIIPVLKKCHSFCIKELLMSTDDPPLGRSELFCVPGEKKGLCYLRILEVGIKIFRLILGSRIPLFLGLGSDMCLVNIYHIGV